MTDLTDSKPLPNKFLDQIQAGAFIGIGNEYRRLALEIVTWRLPFSPLSLWSVDVATDIWNRVVQTDDSRHIDGNSS